MSDAPNPTTLLILGASGDLTRRLLLPGLGSLLAVETDRQVKVMGADRAELSQQEWAQRVRAALASADTPDSVIDAVVDRTEYVQADLLEPDQLDDLLTGAGEDLVLYFALPPAVSIKVCALLEQRGVSSRTRLALEKPFGTDLAAAQAFNTQLLKVVEENRIFRVDHFLGRSTVLNLLGVRFANRLLQPVWSSEHIEKVIISYDEALALEGRAGYYDKAGALVDMIQSHLLQVLAFFAMEAPDSLEESEVRSLKAAALQDTAVWGGDPTTASRRARYTQGSIGERVVPDYTAEEGVDPSRDTETLAELVVGINNDRWRGTPFVLRSGKALGSTGKRIEVFFKPPTHQPAGLGGQDLPDTLVLELKPAEMILSLTINAEGDPFDLEQKELRATLADSRMLAYGEVLGRILDADPLLSIRGDVAEDCWRIVEPVLHAWREGKVPMQEYAAGSSGPQGWGTVPPQKM